MHRRLRRDHGRTRRKLVFAGAAAVLLGITLVLTLRESGPVHRRDARPERRADQSAIRTDPPARPESGVIGDARESTTPASAEPSTMPTPASAPRHEGEAAEAPPPSRPARRARRPPRLARSSRDTCRTATAALTRSGFGRPRSRCFGSWRLRRRACRRASPTLARSSSPCMPRRRPAVQTSTSWP